MATISNGEGGLSVRNKLNEIINRVEGNATITNDVLFGDNDKAIFGAGSDLQIYHSGTNSVIQDSGTGNLNIRADSLNMLNAGGSEYYARFFTNGAANLYHNGNIKLATTSTGIDVTGTVTADGLTVDGDAEFESGKIIINEITGGDAYSEIRKTNTGSNFAISSPESIYMLIDSNNDQTSRSFNVGHNSTGPSGSSTLFTVQESGKVGIGTTSPTDKLNISSGTNQIGLDTGNQATYGTLDLGHFTNGAFIGTQAGTNAASNILRLGTSGTERMRIDSSGNLLVGTTTVQDPTSTTTNGHTLYGGTINVAIHSRNNANPLAVQRTGNDGEIINFFKDAVKVGRIGVTSNRIYVGTGDTGLFFNDQLDSIDPWNTSTNAARDGAIDLGDTSRRFKDLYLSGDITFGGGHSLQANSSNGNLELVSKVNENIVIKANYSGGLITFNDSSGEYARFDSSGNLLVGKTSSDDFTIAGTQIDEDGFIAVTRDGSVSGIFNRKTSDGSILQFRKDNSNVGSIGAIGGDVYFTSSGANAGLRSYDAANALSPVTNTGGLSDGNVSLGYTDSRFKDLYLSGASRHGTGGRTVVEAAKIYDNATNGNSAGIFFGGGQYIGPATGNSGAATDNTVDIGSSSYRFKDLYLSGGVYLGGTGSANKLDDYEEGTFTPSFNVTSGSITVSSANDKLKYTKIGNVCFVSGQIGISSVSTPSGQLWMTGMPFAMAEMDEQAERVVGSTYAQNLSVNINAFDIYPTNAATFNNGSYGLTFGRTDKTSFDVTTAGFFSGDESIGISFFYRTT